MPTVLRQPVTSAFLTALRTITYPTGSTAATTAMAVGAGLPPTRTAAQTADGRYLVTHSLAGGELTNMDLAGHLNEAHFTYQVDAIGKTQAQAEWLDDQVRKVVFDRSAAGPHVVPLAITGWSVKDRDADPPGGVEREADDVWTARTFVSLCVVPG